MNRLKSIAFAFTLCCFISPSISMASPVFYSAFGSVTDNQGRTLPIDGGMYIDDQLRDGNSGLPTDVRDEVGLFFYQYFITGYSLNVGEYAFSGNSGSLYMPLIRFPNLEEWSAGDLMWFLSEGDDRSQWSGWIGEDFSFRNPDGTLQDHSEYISLAESIHLFEMMYLFNDPILSEAPPFNLRLIRNTTATPVPEPSAIVLLGASLLGMTLRSKHRRGQGLPHNL